MNKVTLILLIGLFSCQNVVKEQDTGYLSLQDSTKYAGTEACIACHADKHQTFMHTGMGQSFDYANRQKSSAKGQKYEPIYDRYVDFWYQPIWDKDSLFIAEFRLAGKDTIHKRIEPVSYIIGSGQHTNSHLQLTNGYLCQMPLTFYTQKKQWDLPPGFENGNNSRFTRKIGLECMACHNSFPQLVTGSENKYNMIPNGIGCERCHGPGATHIEQRRQGITPKLGEPDYTIVNPAKLPTELQFDLCQRCHLQGNAVLKKGKSFYSFRPGMKLSDVMTTFLPKYENADDEFIMASHAHRLKQSQCFIKSNQDQNKAKLTCITCHNPHISVKETKTTHFNQICKQCHSADNQLVCKQKSDIRKQKQDNCIVCHMPRSGSIDIPHVTITDHRIQVPTPQKAKNIQQIKHFLGLVAINEENPDSYTRALAYLQQYEKFEKQPYLLDSAQKFLPDKTNIQTTEDFTLFVYYFFLRQDYRQVLSLVQSFGGADNCLAKLNRQSYDNNHAWCCYRIAESYLDSRLLQDALRFLKQADKLSPFNLDFKSKYGKTEIDLGNNIAAIEIFQQIIAENPKHAQSYSNLGYLYLLQGDIQKGENLINQSLKLDPDNEQTLLNQAQVYILKKHYPKALETILYILKKHPQSQKAQEALKALSRLGYK